eukprot:TRINITY_DN62017_c0_g1_i1.p1 TRINITY_DN62017_c0_g1~~TRINITY_DN62017_c0_g1_i1.p1  ORF type:complete len:645 (-),score=103.23 TRINITY_DN62017_c0_g1_i1:96-2030(-)
MADFDPTDYGAPAGGDNGGDGGGSGDPFGLDGGEEDPEGGDIDGEGRQLRDAILFVVDCATLGSLEPLRPGGRSVVMEALAAAISVYKTKVITSPDDRVGVVLYGVRERANPNNFEGIRVLQELDRPSAQRIRQLEVESQRTRAQFQERYGHGYPAPLSDVFWTCTTVFNLSANPKQFQPRVFLFTSNDRPCPTPAEQDAAETRAQDLLDLGVDLEFFPVISPDGAFSIERFWGRVLPVDATDYMDQVALRVEELERRVRRRLHRKRTLHRLSMEVCPGVEVAVSVYVHILEARVPYPVYLLNENNKLLKSETKSICEQTGSIVHPKDDIDTFVEIAGERIFVTRDEIDAARRLGEPGIKLLGFKSADKIKAHHRVYHSYFLFPNERAIGGSTAFIAALIDALLLKKQVALVRYIPRRSSQPVLAAMFPQAEREEGSGSGQVAPPGFNMVLLPWGEDIRSLRFAAPEATVPGAITSPEITGAARRVVASMRLDGFAPGCVENPVVQKHYAAVQALALGEDKPEETIDMLQPDETALAEKAPLLAAWRDALDAGCAAAFAGLGSGCKRSAPPPAADDVFGERPARMPRREAIPTGPITADGMRELVMSGEVDRLTVPALRDWLKMQGIACSGKKGDLVDRVRAVV